MFKFDTVKYNRFLKSQIIDFILPIFVNFQFASDRMETSQSIIKRNHGFIVEKNHLSYTHAL